MTRDTLTAAQRKEYPLARGLFAYFPDALMEVAKLSKVSNEQHNPGQPMHWARDKSTDHADCLLRHQIDAGKRDTDGERHSTKVAWRALAQLQLEIEADNAAELAQWEAWEELCDDEGCPHYGTPHVCVNDIKTQPKFREGDWVVLVDPKALSAARKGDKAVVVEVLPNDILKVAWENSIQPDGGYGAERFQLTTPPMDDPQF